MPAPPPVPKVTSSPVSPGHRKPEPEPKTQRRSFGSSDGRGGRWSEGGVKGSTQPGPLAPLFSSSSSSFLAALFVLFVKEFTEQEGRARSGGRTAARCRWSAGRRRTRRPPGR